MENGQDSPWAVVDAAPPSGRRGFWDAVRTSLAGTAEDFTVGSIPRAVTILAIPMMLELLMESAFGLVDVFFVAKLGADAVASVGIASTLIILVFAVALGLCMAATATVARRIGEGDSDGAAVAAVQALLAGVVASVPISLAGAFWAPEMLRLMGASPAAVEGSGYAAVLFGGSSTIFFIFLINAIFRGAGDAVLAMRSLWLANAVNIVLDPCLIFGWGPFPEMGLTGAAVATTVGRGLGVVYQLRALRSGSRLKIRRRHLRFDPAVMGRLVRISATGMLQFFVAMASWIGLVRIIAVFGDGALAGMTIAVRVLHFAILPAWGLSNAAATLVGQNLGAQKPERAERAVWLTGGYNLVFLGGVAVVFLMFAEPLILLFTSEPGVVKIGVRCLQILSAGYLTLAHGMVVMQAFNGAGDTDTPTLVNLACHWLLQLPLAYLLARTLGWAESGVFVAAVFSGAVWTGLGLVLFRRGRWKQRTV